MSKPQSSQKKKIKLSVPSNQLQSVYNRLLNTSFDQQIVPHPPQQQPSLFQEIKFPMYKVKSLEGEFQRLGEITDRCISYKQRFLQGYQQQMKLFEEVLGEQKEFVYISCEKLIKRVCEKRDQLIEDLIAKQYEVKLYWESSLNQLQNHLLLISKTNMQNIQLSNLNRQQFDDKLDVFTNLVSTFYKKIRILEVKVTEDLDKSQFMQLRHQAKLLGDIKFPSSSVSQNKSFTFNQISPNQSPNVLDKLNLILKNQSERDIKIQSYKENMK